MMFDFSFLWNIRNQNCDKYIDVLIKRKFNLFTKINDNFVCVTIVELASWSINIVMKWSKKTIINFVFRIAHIKMIIFNFVNEYLFLIDDNILLKNIINCKSSRFDDDLMSLKSKFFFDMIYTYFNFFSKHLLSKLRIDCH